MKGYQCEYCGVVLYTPKLLKMHLSAIHHIQFMEGFDPLVQFADNVVSVSTDRVELCEKCGKQISFPAYRVKGTIASTPMVQFGGNSTYYNLVGAFKIDALIPTCPHCGGDI